MLNQKNPTKFEFIMASYYNFFRKRLEFKYFLSQFFHAIWHYLNAKQNLTTQTICLILFWNKHSTEMKAAPQS